MRKLWRIASAGAGAVTLASGLFLASAQAGMAAQPKVHATPSVAIATHHIFETFGAYGVGAPTLGTDDPVVETVDGRSVEFLGDGQGDGGIEIAFTENTSLCVAAANAGVKVVQHACNGGAGTVWFESNGNSGKLFQSREFPGFYLSGADSGSQFTIQLKGASGWFQQFTVE